jgi:bacteriorhodopsin
MDVVTRSSFFFSNVFLMGLTLITLIEAISTPSQKLRNILNLETTVSCVASLFYGFFITKLEDKTMTLDQITPYRYLDWAITTPLLLLVMMIFFKSPVHLTTYLSVALLNYAMLFSGYMGETGQIPKLRGSIYGFGFFVAMLAVMYAEYGSGFGSTDSILFGVFALVWSLYGATYWLDEKKKNIAYNTLDVVAKVFFGLFIWVYYSKIFD